MWKFFIVNELYFEFAEVAIWPCFAKKLLLKYETVLDKQLWRGLSFFKLQLNSWDSLNSNLFRVTFDGMLFL